MRVFFRIAEGMVHSVHYTISPWNQVRGTLCKPGKKINELFSEFRRGIHLVGGIAMQEERMKKQG